MKSAQEQTLTVQDEWSSSIHSTEGTDIHKHEIWRNALSNEFNMFEQNPNDALTNNIVPTADRALPPLSIPSNLDALNTKQRSRVISFYAEQSWDGYIESIEKEMFIARLTDITNNGPSDGEIAEIPLSDLDDSSRRNLQAGQYFRWEIGYERLQTGEKRRVSKIVIRQLPAWKSNDLTQARERAQALSEKIIWK